jgi:hypothetical protein
MEVNGTDTNLSLQLAGVHRARGAGEEHAQLLQNRKKAHIQKNPVNKKKVRTKKMILTKSLTNESHQIRSRLEVVNQATRIPIGT